MPMAHETWAIPGIVKARVDIPWCRTLRCVFPLAATGAHGTLTARSTRPFGLSSAPGSVTLPVHDLRPGRKPTGAPSERASRRGGAGFELGAICVFSGKCGGTRKSLRLGVTE